MQFLVQRDGKGRDVTELISRRRTNTTVSSSAPSGSVNWLSQLLAHDALVLDGRINKWLSSVLAETSRPPNKTGAGCHAGN